MVEWIFAVAVSLQTNLSRLQPIEAHATAYCVTGVTKSGQITHDGICAAKEEWLGKYAAVFKRLPDNTCGEFIGIYEIADTGGTDGLKNGRVVDIWKPDLDSCQAFMNLVYEDDCEGKVFIFVLDPPQK